MTDTIVKPTKIQRLTKSNCLGLHYGEQRWQLPAEFLRVHSPSAEVRQHGKPILVSGKSQVILSKIEAVGLYGIKLTFDDGHDSGIYTWQYLQELVNHQTQYWQEYLQKMHQAQASRDPQTQVVQIQAPPTTKRS